MKYKMLISLPFVKREEIFGKGCWCGGGWGVDRGSSPSGSHNGIKTFRDFENKLLDSILLNKEWVKMLPENTSELLSLHEDGYYDKHEVLDLICLK